MFLEPDKSVLSYMDDHLITSKNTEDHTLYTQKCFKIIKKSYIIFNRSKGSFDQRRANFLGFTILRQEIRHL